MKFSLQCQDHAGNIYEHLFFSPLTFQPIEFQGLPIEWWSYFYLSAERTKPYSPFRIDVWSAWDSWCLSNPTLPLQISSCPNLSRCWVGADPTYRSKPLHKWDRSSVTYSSTNSKHPPLLRVTIGLGLWQIIWVYIACVRKTLGC